MTNEIKPEEAKTLVDKLGPHIGGGLNDFTLDPNYLETRKDVCAVRRMAEDGQSYGFDTFYLLWKPEGSEIKYEKLVDSKRTKDYLHLGQFFEDEKDIFVQIYSGGVYSGDSPVWEFKRNKEELGLYK